MKTSLIALLVAFSTPVWAQLGNYLGPAILTRGASNIGQRSGQDVDLRFYVNARGIYDTGLNPVSVDSNGDLVRVGGLSGVEAGIGAYGRHTWRRAALGLDFSGTYRHYQRNTFFNGSNNQLALGYTFQKSPRLVFDMQALAGTASFATNFANTYLPVYDAVVDENTLLFDNRVNYIQGSMDTSFILNPRTMITLGGSGFMVHRQSKALIGVNGYDVHGSLRRRLSAATTIGATYKWRHFDYPRAFGESDITQLTGEWGRQIGRPWFVNISGGVALAEVQGLQRVAVDPAISRLLGISSTVQVFYRKNTLPIGQASIRYNWRNASWMMSYSRGIAAGNGVFLTSRQESLASSIGYTGVRNWSFGLSGSTGRVVSLGQDLPGFRQYLGGTTITYALTRAINLTASFMLRYSDTDNASFKRNSTRTTIGIYFSPGDIPISFR